MKKTKAGRNNNEYYHLLLDEVTDLSLEAQTCWRGWLIGVRFPTW
jgi:hypothetical protein